MVFSDACTHILKMCIHLQLNQDVANQITHVHTPAPQTCSYIIMCYFQLDVIKSILSFFFWCY